jgi:hypothetical protein
LIVWLNLDARPQFDNPIARDIEEIGDASGVARHRREDAIAPSRQSPFTGSRDDLLARQEVGHLHRIELQSLRRANLERKRDIGPLEEAVMRTDAPAAVLQWRAHHPILGADPGNVPEFDGEEYVLLVQDLVVLEAVQQRVRRRIGARRQEYGGALYTLGRIQKERLQKSLQRRRPSAQAFQQSFTSAPSTSENQPPSRILCMAAANSTPSISMKNAVAPTHIHSG